MSEPIFFKRTAMSVAEIATITGADVRPGTAAVPHVNDVAPLDRAGPADLTFLEKAKHAGGLARSRAGVCLTSAALSHLLPNSMTALLVKDPYRAFVIAARAMFPDGLRPSSLFAASGIASGASIHPTARLEDGVTVDPGVVIGAGAEIGSGTTIAAGASIGPGVRIGRGCTIGASATIVHALIGDRVVIHPGARLGQDGFGYLPGASHLKIPQLRRVIVQDDVEIGSNSTIDRGGLRDTVIGEGTKIDNLVQIGHNVEIGRHCILVSQVGVSGSARLGDYVVLGGQVGVADHAEIGEGAQVAAKSGVMGVLAPRGRYSGAPAIPQKEHFRQVVLLAEMARRKSPPQAGRNADGDPE